MRSAKSHFRTVCALLYRSSQTFFFLRMYQLMTEKIKNRAVRNTRLYQAYNCRFNESSALFIDKKIEKRKLFQRYVVSYEKRLFQVRREFEITPRTDVRSPVLYLISFEREFWRIYLEKIVFFSFYCEKSRDAFFRVAVREQNAFIIIRFILFLFF